MAKQKHLISYLILHFRITTFLAWRCKQDCTYK